MNESHPFAKPGHATVGLGSSIVLTITARRAVKRGVRVRVGARHQGANPLFALMSALGRATIAPSHPERGPSYRPAVTVGPGRDIGARGALSLAVR